MYGKQLHDEKNDNKKKKNCRIVSSCMMRLTEVRNRMIIDDKQSNEHHSHTIQQWIVKARTMTAI